ncbi:unnamed protein product [Cylindrotheca closterium]|uniref:Uncharacterized protein n=1 Tax=Cylindrotheca closterium TaxID=2856 RepID=A0AAD2G127_9STRA|nr:unnamed protein product [Cylindrotheca closterium]
MSSTTAMHLSSTSSLDDLRPRTMKHQVLRPQHEGSSDSYSYSYSWTETEWQTLLMDAATSTATTTSSLLDGQQEGFVTVTLLLASIRDAMLQRQQRAATHCTNNQTFDHDQANRVIAEIDQILSPQEEEEDNNNAIAAQHEGPLNDAKQYFDAMLSMFSNGEVMNLLKGVYTKLTIMTLQQQQQQQQQRLIEEEEEKKEEESL